MPRRNLFCFCPPKSVIHFSKLFCGLQKADVLAFTVNFNSQATELFSVRRQSTQSFDNASLSASVKQKVIDSNIGNYAEIKSSVSSNNIYTSNARDLLNVLDTASAALGEIHKELQDLQDLANLGKNVTLTTAQRTEYGAEVTTALRNIEEISKNTVFGETPLLDGSFSKKKYQTGATSADIISVSIGNSSPKGLGLSSVSRDSAKEGLSSGGTTNVTQFTVNIDSASGANDSLGAISAAMDAVNASLSNINIAKRQLDQKFSTQKRTDMRLSSRDTQYSKLIVETDNKNLVRNDRIDLNAISTILYKYHDVLDKTVSIRV